VLKLRGARAIPGVHFFDITPAGLKVYPRVRAPETIEDRPDLAQRDSTGVAGLDELLDGGLPRGSSTVIQGGTGTGKTILGLNFLMAGVEQGERGVLFTLEESPNQLREIARALGWPLAELEAEGRLAVIHDSPVELSTDRFLNDARAEVARLGAHRVVFDSLTTMSLGVPSERRFKELVYAITKHMRSAGVSLLMTMESEQLLGAANLSGLGFSFIADNLIQLRYLEMNGQLDRAISVIKARGVRMKSELRPATIGQGGLTVGSERWKELRGVLTGLPTR
jgi:circadian clock protein KaiC